MVAGVFLGALSVLLGACGSSGTKAAPSTTATATTVAAPTEFAGYVRTPPLDVSSVTLPTVDGTPVDMVADPGGFLILFFGYATCPDVCPLTLTNLKVAINNQTEADRKLLRAAVVTVDPTRDTADKFATYVEQYFPNGYAIRTDDPAELRAAANVFGAEYRTGTNAKGEREVTHSGDLYVIDDTGTVVLGWPYGVSPEEITADLGRLLAGDRPGTEGDDR